jgi:CRISPR-associated protein Csy3
MYAVVPKTVAKDGGTPDKMVPFTGVESVLLKQGNFDVYPVLVTPTTVRGTISHAEPGVPAAARVDIGEKALNAANIARIEEAKLPSDAEWLLVIGEVRFMCHARQPQACDHEQFHKLVTQWYDAYAEKGGTRELALRIVLRTLSGSWLWRNAYGDEVQVGVMYDGKMIVIGEDDIDMEKGFTLDAIAESQRPLVDELVSVVADVLADQREKAVLTLAGFVRMGRGATVYPSQELSSEATEEAGDKDRARQGDLSRVLSKNRNVRGEPVATIHARKVGNALRTIDTWHGASGVGAIAVEPFGANTHQSVAHRIHDNDFYTLLGNPKRLKERLEEEPDINGDHHFVAGCLLRGGVYGFGKREKQAAAAQAANAIASAAAPAAAQE